MRQFLDDYNNKKIYESDPFAKLDQKVWAAFKMGWNGPQDPSEHQAGLRRARGEPAPSSFARCRTICVLLTDPCTIARQARPHAAILASWPKASGNTGKIGGYSRLFFITPCHSGIDDK
jgi:hypothetical protein